MCLIALSWRDDPQYPLAMIANRDEFYRRPTLPAAYWKDTPQILAGRDEQQGGSWLGVHTSGRFAAVTNARGAASAGKQPPSRGALVANFLNSEQSAADFGTAYLAQIGDYAGCNLLIGDDRQLFYLTNHPQAELRELPPGSYAVSNGHIDDSWPKMQQLSSSLEQALQQGDVTSDALLALLTSQEKVADEHLPNTGVNKLIEKQLSSIFIQLPAYGTRCSTVLLADTHGQLGFHERSFDKRGRASHDARFDLNWPWTL